MPELYGHFNQGYSPYSWDQEPIARIVLIRQQKKQSTKIRKQLGETRGFSLRQGAVSRYYLTADNRAVCTEATTRKLILVNGSDTFTPSTLTCLLLAFKRDESAVTAIWGSTGKGTGNNPFAMFPSCLLSISTGAALRGRTFLRPTQRPCKRGKRPYPKFPRNVLKREQAFMTPVKKAKLESPFGKFQAESCEGHKQGDRS
ncbi:hypothetical protein GWK47_042671 [Chionoecetes opilio]|uniref:Uncharacterized protein n=1 Tax=Chionoecetes opilio TaxID=41210 RepID=A0A8J4YH23_CHIOP|nr:hypothetical protein GWK47_042671 [Chionoecetes opilio]